MRSFLIPNYKKPYVKMPCEFDVVISWATFTKTTTKNNSMHHAFYLQT